MNYLKTHLHILQIMNGTRPFCISQIGTIDTIGKSEHFALYELITTFRVDASTVCMKNENNHKNKLNGLQEKHVNKLQFSAQRV